MKLIAGLGNPGAKYTMTRHNAGFLLVDKLADSCGVSITNKKFNGFYGRGRFLGDDVVFLKPETFMNLSGGSVLAAIQFFKVEPKDLIVIHDDLDMETFKVKAKFGGGHGGHNGIRDILAKLGHGDFNRIKVGIGRPAKAKEGAVYNWVLGPFTGQDVDELQSTVTDEVVLRLENIFKR